MAQQVALKLKGPHHRGTAKVFQYWDGFTLHAGAFKVFVLFAC
jgi:hypothetical protein